jgi:lipoprotein-anchoring transpeptidase ErfK/SrfK
MSHRSRLAAIAGATAAVALIAGCSAVAAAPAAQAPQPSVHHSSAPLSAPVQKTTPAAAPATTKVAAPAKPAPPAAAAACVGTPAGAKHVYVSISEQHLWACTGTTLLTEAPVTTGASALTNVHDATPTGTFAITGKIRNTVLAGSDVNGPWNDPVQYWMPFVGGDGFHDASWQKFPLGSPLYTTQGSHGCIHLPLATIATIFGWVDVGTPVTIRA